MKAVVAAFNQEKALVGAFSVITNLRMDLFEALLCQCASVPHPPEAVGAVCLHRALAGLTSTWNMASSPSGHNCQLSTETQRCTMLHKATGEHFNRPGHKISDMIMTIIEKVHSNDPMVLSVREEHWIKRGNTKYRGINRNKG